MKRIDEVISKLGEIIEDAKENNDTAGYFAALYQKVTIRVKEGIENGFFDDGKRMEQFDILFAQRYIDAWEAYKEGEDMTLAWEKAFDLTREFKPIMLQHLLAGMNAHINLDLGIAAAQTQIHQNLNDLENDFKRINEVLSELVHEVQGSLSAIWPLLKVLLRWSGKVDDYLVDFSMELARDGAWRFAQAYHKASTDEKFGLLLNRDMKVSDNLKVVTQPGRFASFILRLVRFTEKGSVAEKIQHLQKSLI